MPRRRGGHKAKLAIRSAPLSEKSKPVHPGESGGQYKPLDDQGVVDIVANCFCFFFGAGLSGAGERQFYGVGGLGGVPLITLLFPTFPLKGISY